jgi:ribosome biogenesis GTPase / thiamine phosphate phosphatase
VKEGLVIKTTGSWFTVEDEKGELFECKVKGNFRIKDIKSTNPVAVGDRVNFLIHEDQKNNAVKSGWITPLTTGKTTLSAVLPICQSNHILLLQTSIRQCWWQQLHFPVTTTTFIDRYLASAEAYRVPVLIVFNKIDLYSEKEQKQLDELIAIYGGHWL